MVNWTLFSMMPSGNLHIDRGLVVGFVIGHQKPFGLCRIRCMQTFLPASDGVLNIPATTGPSEDSKFFGHFVAHGCEATTVRVHSVSDV